MLIYYIILILYYIIILYYKNIIKIFILSSLAGEKTELNFALER